MAFNYKGTMVNFDNYKEVFKDLSPDSLDEIRLAIMDGVSLGSFVDKNHEDSYKLGQIRLFLREMLPLEFLNTALSGRCLHKIRQIEKSTYSLNTVYDYVTVSRSGVLPDKYLEEVLDLVLSGVDISNSNFFNVRYDIFDLYCKGLELGYPMWALENAKYDTKILTLLMKAMSLNFSVNPFIDYTWSYEQILTILSFADIGSSNIFKFITNKFNEDQIEYVCKIIKMGYSPKVITGVDPGGVPLYDAFQMEVIHDAIKNQVWSDVFKNPELSDLDMKEKLEELLKKKEIEKKRVLGGRL